MKIRYKKHPSVIRHSFTLNLSALFEVSLGDDSACPKDLEVWLGSTNSWKCMSESFRDNDLITNNLNTCFRESKNSEERNKGYYL